MSESPSAYASTIPAPPSSRPGPGIARAYSPLSDIHATPRQLKAEAIRLRPLTGMRKRETARVYKAGCSEEDKREWETIRGWLDPRAKDRTPPRRFVQFLNEKAEAVAAEARALEVLCR